MTKPRNSTKNINFYSLFLTLVSFRSQKAAKKQTKSRRPRRKSQKKRPGRPFCGQFPGFFGVRAVFAPSHRGFSGFATVLCDSERSFACVRAVFAAPAGAWAPVQAVCFLRQGLARHFRAMSPPPLHLHPFDVPGITRAARRRVRGAVQGSRSAARILTGGAPITEVLQMFFGRSVRSGAPRKPVSLLTRKVALPSGEISMTLTPALPGQRSFCAPASPTPRK